MSNDLHHFLQETAVMHLVSAIWQKLPVSRGVLDREVFIVFSHVLHEEGIDIDPPAARSSINFSEFACCLVVGLLQNNSYGRDALVSRLTRLAQKDLSCTLNVEWLIQGKTKIASIGKVASEQLELKYSQGAEMCFLDWEKKTFLVDFDSCTMTLDNEDTVCLSLVRRTKCFRASKKQSISRSFRSNTFCSVSFPYPVWATRLRGIWKRFSIAQTMLLEKEFRKNGNGQFRVRFGTYHYDVFTHHPRFGACLLQGTISFPLLRVGEGKPRVLTRQYQSKIFAVPERELLRDISPITAAIVSPTSIQSADLFDSLIQFVKANKIIIPKSEFQNDFFQTVVELVEKYDIDSCSFVAPVGTTQHEMYFSGVWVPLSDLNNWLLSNDHPVFLSGNWCSVSNLAILLGGCWCWVRPCGEPFPFLRFIAKEDPVLLSSEVMAHSTFPSYFLKSDIVLHVPFIIDAQSVSSLLTSQTVTPLIHFLGLEKNVILGDETSGEASAEGSVKQTQIATEIEHDELNSSDVKEDADEGRSRQERWRYAGYSLHEGVFRATQKLGDRFRSCPAASSQYKLPKLCKKYKSQFPIV